LCHWGTRHAELVEASRVKPALTMLMTVKTRSASTKYNYIEYYTQKRYIRTKKQAWAAK
jgi:hypothetical protein